MAPVVAALSGAILCLQVLYTRVFSAVLFYHFTFVAVAVGMLAISAGALHTVLLPQNDAQKNEENIFRYSISFSIAIVVSLFLILSVPHWLSGESISAIAVYYFACFFSFYFAGKALALIFSTQSENFSRLYAIDFLAAAAGCLLAAPLLLLYGGPGAILLVAMLPLAFLYFALDKSQKKKKTLVASIFLSIMILLFAGQRFAWLTIFNPAVKDHALLYESWNPISRITVNEVKTSPWLQENYFEPLVSSDKLIFIDAWATTPVVPKEAWHSEIQLKNDLSAAPYSFTSRERALIIGAGGGRDILVALRLGFQNIDAVEINPAIAHLMQSPEFEEYSGGVYTNPKVHLHVMDGRTYVRESEFKYDNIQLTLVDTFASTAAGAFALSENNLYTVEAVQTYIQRLKETGVLAISRWSGPETIRLFHILQAAALREGISDIRPHVALLASRLSPESPSQASLLLFSKKPFDANSAAAIRKFSANAKLPLLYDPLLKVSSKISDIISAKDPLAESLQTQAYEQRPSTDDWPFFFFRPTTNYWGKIFSHPEILFLTPEYTALGISLLSVLFCVSILFLPILWNKSGILHRQQIWDLPYFFMIGLGFMFVEMPWLQRCVLYLGHPSLAMMAVLSSLLFGSGIGAWSVHRMFFRINGVGAGVLAALILLIMEFLRSILIHSQHWPIALKIGITFFFFLPVSFVLGTLLPIGMKKMSQQSATLVAWAWAVNGCASVLGSSLAILSALFCGFNFTAMAGISLYLGAAIFAWRRKL